MIQIVVCAVLLALSIRKAKSIDHENEAMRRGAEVLSDIFQSGFKIFEYILTWIVRLVPLAVMGVVAQAVGEAGLAPLTGLGWYLATAALGLFSHALLVYHGELLLIRVSLRRFWKCASTPVVYAVGSNSSLATLPLTLTALKKLGVSNLSANIGAAVLTNFNNDGIVLYEGAALLFVAQAHGINLSIGQQLIAAFYAMLAAIGIAGVPEAGFVSLSLVLSTVGLPTQLLPLLLTVDWIIARGRTAVNVLSDMLVSTILDKWCGTYVLPEQQGGEEMKTVAAPSETPADAESGGKGLLQDQQFAV